jgi:hypothetical protein
LTETLFPRKPPTADLSFFAMKKALQDTTNKDRETEERNK